MWGFIWVISDGDAVGGVDICILHRPQSMRRRSRRHSRFSVSPDQQLCAGTMWSKLSVGWRWVGPLYVVSSLVSSVSLLVTIFVKSNLAAKRQLRLFLPAPKAVISNENRRCEYINHRYMSPCHCNDVWIDHNWSRITLPTSTLPKICARIGN